jgi:autotransporter-associated beta strand protein
MNIPITVRHRAILPLLTAAASSFLIHARAADGTWTSAAGGNWSDPVNWLSGTPADGPDSAANFNTLDLTADIAVAVDGVRTIGNLAFGDTGPLTPFGWAVSGSLLTLQTSVGTPTITTDVAATISSQIGGTQGFVKNGAGTLTLSAVGTNTGPVVIEGGTLRVAVLPPPAPPDPAISTYSSITANSGTTLALTITSTVATKPTVPALQLNNATLDLNGVANSATLSNTVTVLSDSTVNATYGGNKNINILGNTGTLIGSSTLTLNMVCTDTALLTLGDGGSANSLSAFTGTIAFTPASTGQLRLGSGGNTGSAGVWGNSDMKLDFGTSSAYIQARNGNTALIVGELQSEGTGARLIGPGRDNGFSTNFVVGGRNTNSVFNGTIVDNLATAERKAVLTKVGTGTLTLGNANTYTGATNVNAGALIVNGSLGVTTVTVASGATLAGSGTINGPVNLQSGARLLAGAGNVGETLTLTGILDAQTLGAATFQFALGAAGAHSTLAQSGAVGSWLFDPNTVFTFIDAGAQVGLYDNIITGLAADPGVATWTTTDGWAGTFTYDGAGGVDFNLTTVGVPEPGIPLLLGAAGMVLLLRRRLRQS